MKYQYDRILALPKPFVKWAGGKRQLIPTLDANMPKKFGAYFEPFLGGGALMFHILAKNIEQVCRVSDLNYELVTAYVTIRDKVEDLILSLKNHERNYAENPEQYYYSVRQTSPSAPVEQTSRMLFLNKTCFNGLYRVNSKGEFNVPLGRYSNPNIVNGGNLRSVSQLLQSSKLSIKCCDFEGVLENAKKNDFVYFDPPYQPVSKTSNFTSYVDKAFTNADFYRLCELCEELNSCGCHVLLSNSDSDIVSEMFSKQPWKIYKTRANRLINSNSKKRLKHYELLVKNY